MDEQYGMVDLRQLLANGSSSSTRPHFPQQYQHQDLLFAGVVGDTHRNQLSHANHHNYEMMMMSGQVTHEMFPCGSLQHEFHTHRDSTNIATTPPTTTSVGGCGGGGTSSGTFSGLEATDVGCIGGGSGGGDGSTGRWPRQETLFLLEIRSRLDQKFKEANQKGPLWDEVSRLMSEEHGYQRSGKKCREKFENLYKYYKKTKEGKASRQDGKHYRFFRQLEALYGSEKNTINNNNNNIPISSLSENQLLIAQNLPFHSSTSHKPNDDSTNINQEPLLFQRGKISESLSLSNSSEFDTSSSDDSVEKSKKKRARRSWKAKIKEFIDTQMRKLMEKQEAWLEKMMKTIDHKEQERVLREQEWRKQEVDRVDKEHKFWAGERAWIEARDAALMEAMHKFTGKEIYKPPNLPNNENWPETEITRLIQLRISMESRFQECGSSEEVLLWEEIATKIGCFGYDHTKSALSCKAKWDSINNYWKKTKDCDINKKRKESYYQNNNHEISLYNNQGIIVDGSSSSPSNSNPAAGNNSATTVQESCFHLFMGDGDHQSLWDNYGNNQLNHHVAN